MAGLIKGVKGLKRALLRGLAGGQGNTGGRGKQEKTGGREKQKAVVRDSWQGMAREEHLVSSKKIVINKMDREEIFEENQ